MDKRALVHLLLVSQCSIGLLHGQTPQTTTSTSAATVQGSSAKQSPQVKPPASNSYEISNSPEAFHPVWRPVSSAESQQTVARVKNALTAIATAPANGIEAINGAIREGAEALAPYLDGSARAAGQGLSQAYSPIQEINAALAEAISKTDPAVVKYLAEGALDGLKALAKNPQPVGTEMTCRIATKIQSAATVLEGVQDENPSKVVRSRCAV